MLMVVWLAKDKTGNVRALMEVPANANPDAIVAEVLEATGEIAHPVALYDATETQRMMPQ